MKSIEILRKMNIIKCMGSYQEDYFDIAKQYAPLLDKGNVINDTVYTLHDFSHHCINIYRILNDVLLSDYAFSDDGFTSEEFFLLNISVLLHDISMTRLIHFDRNLHSDQSALFIMDEHRNTSSIISKIITRQQLNAIMLIVKAHSNIKTNGEIINTLLDINLTNEMPGYGSNIRAKLLAGLLRLADELDVTNARLGNDLSYYNQLDKDFKGEAISKEHWMSLMCFKNIRVKKDNVSIIELEVDDEYIVRETDNKIEIKRRIQNVINKIRIECSYIMENIILVDKKASQFIVVRNVEINSKVINNPINGLYMGAKEPNSRQIEMNTEVILETNEDILKKKKIILIVTALEKELKPLIDMIAFPLSLGIIKIDNNLLYTLDITSDSTLIATSFNGMGTITAALSMQNILMHFDVNAVILTGFCGGLNRDTLDFGDIIISNEIINYDIAKINDNSEDIRWDVYRSNDHLRRGLLNNTSVKWKEYIKKTFPKINKTPKIFSGAVFSGDKLFASSKEIEKLLTYWRKALAVEMEAAGISAALHILKQPPSFVMVKSVCDFADSTKGDEWQDFAATVAASFVIDYVFSFPKEI